MLFHSIQFGVFFIVVYLLYISVSHKWQNRMLLTASYVFYGAWEWRYLSLIFISTTVDYFCAHGIEKSSSSSSKKIFIAVSVFVNSALLCVFKYYDFFALNFQSLMGTFGLEVHPYFLNVALPIGISFYTFQTMSYSIDVYRGKVKASRNFLDFALYVSFFPQLISGPIERGTRLLPQIIKPREITRQKQVRGAYLFIWGLFLKVFIADNLAAIVDPVFDSAGIHSGGDALLAVYAFSFQIYCDFAGYSFMAIGLALAMGISLMENFRRPYFSLNISDFWRRWHISLSSWFRDYLFSPFYMYLSNFRYIRDKPLNVRHGIAFFITLFVTEFLLGLWHGAGWNFALFGVYHALLIWAYYYTRQYWDRLNKFVQIVLTYHLACVGWLIFRSSSISQVSEMFYSMVFNFNASVSVDELAAGAGKFVALVFILIVIQIWQNIKNDTDVVLKWPWFVKYAFVIILCGLTVLFGDFGGRSFIYFQF